MKIYIAGILGMLGYNIANTLKDRCDIVGMDIVDLHIDNIKYWKGSLYDMERVEGHILTEAPDVLIHTAAMVNVDKCEVEPQIAENLNVNVTRDLAKICNKNKIKMIYISTDAVFDGEKARLYTEEDSTNPINVYGKTKLKGEQYVLAYKDNVVLRTNIYGKNIQKKNSLGEWIYNELINSHTINMFSDIDFSPILVNELAEIIYLIIKKDISGLYHACGTGCITKYEFGVRLKEIFGIKTGEIVKSISDFANFSAKRSKHMGMSNEKLKKALGIEISTPEEGLYKFYEIMEEKNGD